MADFTLRQLAHFVAIAEEGSIAGAAARQHFSPSALAASLDDLEKAVGARLCQRRKAHGIVLTADGELALAMARDLLSRAVEFGDRLAAPDGQLAGAMTVGCYRTLAPTVLPTLLEGFGAVHPQVRLDFVEGGGDELQEMLASGRIDAAILYDRDVSGDFDAVELYRIRPHVLLPSTHPMAGRRSVRLARLADEPFILLDLPPSTQNTMAIFDRVGVSPQVRHRTTSYELTRALVGRGLGYTVLVQRTRTDRTYDGHEVRICEISPEMPAIRVMLLRRHGSDNAKAQALADFATDHVEAFSPLGG
ncbi:hypothetical protein ASE14_04810 [Agromyces sp. Root81]|uniref:LysR substrate-binding domain-containing protein n=1 Tax=Agromyces sp. Root81 TaxID=1736601 RepID=UPI0006FE2C2B|nr:LysR substrate-binding domain-containing protein [Agromyces sp. Root81]KRC63100.1 hypothetical protein ASE14_04810 [Agromyces sp. Root81]